MADILPRELPAAPTVSPTASLISDNGVTVEKATPLQITAADTRLYRAPFGEVALPFDSLTSAEGKFLAVISSTIKPVDAPAGPTGPTGPADNTYTSLASFKAQDITNKAARMVGAPGVTDGSFNWTLGDFTGLADDENIIKADSTALSVGAWVRQRATSVQTNGGSTVQADLDYQIRSTSDEDRFQQIVREIAAGTAHTAAFFGDSTWQGTLDSGGFNPTPPPAQAQALIRNFFGNTAFTASNLALAGTSIRQMLAGDPPYTEPFEETIAALPSSVSIVGCNHARNTVFYDDSDSSFESDVREVVRIIRKYGKVPFWASSAPGVTVSPNGTDYGSPTQAAMQARLYDIVRRVCADMGVRLVDQYAMFEDLFARDTPYAYSSDGVHRNANGQRIEGCNLARFLLGAYAPSFNRPGQLVGASQQLANGGAPASPLLATSSRGGALAYTVNTVGQSLNIVFTVDAPGLDINLGFWQYNSLDSDIIGTLNGVGIPEMKQFIAGFTDPFIVDAQLPILRNVPMGFYLLRLEATNALAVSTCYLSSSASTKPALIGTGAEAKERLPSIANASSSADAIILSDTFFDWYLEDGAIEFTASLEMNSGFIVAGIEYAGLSGARTPTQGVMVGLNGSGYCTVWERDTPSNLLFSALDTTDHSGTSKRYRIEIAQATREIEVFIDGGSAGTYTITQNHYGGRLGVWKFTGADPAVTITEIDRIWTS